MNGTIVEKYDLSYVYDDEVRAEIKRWIKDYSRKEPLKVEIVDDAMVLPRKKSTKNEPYTWMGLGGVLDRDDNFVNMSGIKHLVEDAFVFGGKYSVDDTEVEYVDEEVIYVGPMFNHWGHFIYDFITRLWYCLEHTDKSIVYCGWGFDEGSLYGSYKRLFELLEIDLNKLIDIRKPTRFRRVVIPEQCYLRNQYVMPEYYEMMKKICSNVAVDGRQTYDKIYFTRDPFIRRSAWYREYGENIIQKIFENGGYKVFDPSTLSLDEQIYYVNHCDTIALIGSSTGADTAFMREGTERIYLKKCFYMDPDLSQLDYMTNVSKVTVIDCWLRPYNRYKGNHASGPNLIGITSSLREFLSDNEIAEISKSKSLFHNFRVYLWFGLACVRNALFTITYPIYFKTLRKIIRGE